MIRVVATLWSLMTLAGILHATPSDTTVNQQFLHDMTTVVPTQIAECIARGWNITRPPIREGYRLKQGWPSTTSLDSVRTWWHALPSEYRPWGVCEGHFPDRLLLALGREIAAQRTLPVIEELLRAIVDTSQFDQARYVASRILADSAAAVIVVAARATGDAHRYDNSIADYYGYDCVNYHAYRGQAMALLGRLYFVQGRLTEARQAGMEAKRLHRWSDPLLLTDIALRQGDTVTAVRELAFCRVAVSTCSNTPDRDSSTGRQLMALYGAVNHRSLAGMDTLLKRALHDPVLQFPTPITPWRNPEHDHHSSNTQALARVSVLQYYTDVHCGNCSRHDISAEAMRQRYGTRLIVLAYHYAPPLTIPGWSEGWNDMKNFNTPLFHLLHVGPNNTTARHLGPHDRGCDWWIDGGCFSLSVFAGVYQLGALVDYDQTLPLIERRLTTPPQVHLSLQAAQRNDRVTTMTTVTGLPQDNRSGHHLKVQVVLVEDSLLIPGAGNSPVQNHVVRAVAGDSAAGFGTLLPTEGTTHVVHETFDIGALEQLYRRKAEAAHASDGDASSLSEQVYHIDRRQLSVIAYVQDQTTGEILQAAQQKL